MGHGICAICGKVKETGREHVPPRGLFLKPRPTNTLTVPLCSGCNHSYHLDDEYFRVYVAAGATPGTKLMRLWKEKVVGSSLARSGGLKGRLQDEYDQLVEHAAKNPLELFGGGHLPPELLPLVQGFDAKRINRVVAKIVRCLYFHHKGEVLDAGLEIDVSPLSEETWNRTMSEPLGEVGHDREFVYREEGESPTVWRLIFYEHHAFTVAVQ
ncbi:MAG TPA: hypothetical protein VLF66_15370 [Thermoanaerobaculia bacterium]|nr:hypothetical protein [Thermoanaerobaculia bacterium]